MKWCPGCAQWRQAGDFQRNRAQADGLQVHCKDCRWRIDRARREKSREYEQRYRAARRAKSAGNY